MKKLFTLMAVTALAIAAFAQSPQKMSYQCVVRNSSGALVPNQAVGMKISILKGSATGTVVFSETYSPNPQTNANGLVTVEIGSGTASVGIFAGIDWSAGPYFLKTETDPAGATTYTITGTSQLLSVPYALYAKTAANGFSGAWADITGKPTFAALATTGNYNDLLNKPTLFSGSYNDLTNKPALFDGTWNSLTGKPAGFADGIDNVDDADNSITNEIQALSLSGTVLTLSNGGGSVTLPSSGGGDNWGTQTVVTNTTLTGAGTTANPLTVANTVITPSWANIQGLPVGFADGIDNVDDADNSVTNEIQTLSIVGSSLSLSNGGGSVTIPGDGWGSQATVTNTTLTGNGTTASPLRIAQQSATNGQVLKWNNTSSLWTPSNDETGGLTLPWSGSATSALMRGVFEITDNRTNGGGAISYGLAGITKSVDGVGVYGQADATIGYATGVIGSTNSSSGSGVHGQGLVYGIKGVATSVSIAKTYGVYGSAISSEGYGIYGEAPIYGTYGKSTGSTGRAVVGEATGTASIGVQGIATNTSSTGVWGEGANQGVYGNSSTATGKGVYGFASHTTGNNHGVYGETKSDNGYGVQGKSPYRGLYGISTGGGGAGVYGEVTSDSGFGVSGKGAGGVKAEGIETGITALTTKSSGLTYGVFAQVISPDGTAVYGYGLSETGFTCGIRGITNSPDGYGVRGESPRYGVYGKSSGNTGRAVKGEAIGTASIGVYGIALSTSSTGVWGEGANYDFYAAGPGVNYGNSSSIRWKRNIEIIPQPLEKIKAIRGVYFDWDADHGGQHDVGMIAEEVGKVLPEIVVYEENGIDASGMDYSKITPLLLEAIKEQQKQIDELKALVSKLMANQP
jgi:trimeric autotransporter adhesin